MDTKELQKLRQALPKGSKAKLADRFGLSEAYISLVLRGHRKNEEVIIAAAEIVAEHKAKLEATQDFIQSL